MEKGIIIYNTFSQVIQNKKQIRTIKNSQDTCFAKLLNSEVRINN